MRSWLAVLAGMLPLLAAPNRARIVDAFGNLPLTFEENQGQTGPQVKFISRAGRFNLFLTETDAVLAFPSSASSIRMRLEGARKPDAIQGLDRQPGTSNYFSGSDPQKWHSAVPHFSRVRYREVYPGVDVVYRGSRRQLEYDFLLKPGADASQIVLGFQGVEGPTLDSQGGLVLKSADGELRERRPIAYQETAGVRRSVDVEYRMLADHRVGFRLGDYDKSAPLTIDPILSYSTYLGGNGSEYLLGLAVDAGGSAYVYGTTQSPNFPTTPGSYNTSFPGMPYSAFVSKLSPGGTQLIYSTFLGAVQVGYGGITVDGSGNAYVTGFVGGGSGFPTTPGAYSTFGTAFAAKLNSTGTQLVYSTLLGTSTSGQTVTTGIAIDGQGNAYVTGNTIDTAFPTTPGAFQVARGPYPGNPDAFVMKLNGNGTALVYSTLLGGSGTDYGYTIVVDGQGSAYVSGVTAFSDPAQPFPVTQGAFQTSITNNGVSTGFITKLNSAGSALIFSTYLTGSNGSAVNAIALDASTNVIAVGNAYSADFPVTNGAFQTTDPTAGPVGFVTKLKSTGDALIYSTFLSDNVGCSSNQNVAVDSQGNAWVVGQTGSGGSNSCGSSVFPTTADAIQPYHAGFSDGFLLKLDSTGSIALFSTYLGGSNDDVALGVALDSLGHVYVAGNTQSSDFTTTAGAFQPDYGGFHDIFAAKIDMSVATCNYSLSASGDTLPYAAGSSSFMVMAPSGCAWVATHAFDNSVETFVTITSGARGSGTSTVNFSVPANTSSQNRSNTLLVRQMSFTVTQLGAPCSSSISRTSQNFPSSGGAGSLGVTAPPSCSGWLATSDVDWIVISGNGTGSGNGQVFYNVAQNLAAPRTGHITVTAGSVTNRLTVTQDGTPVVNAVSVTPSAGSGSSQTFSFVFSDTNGFGDLSTTYMLINSVLNWPNACYTIYDRNANTLSLLSDSATYFVGSVTPGQSTTLQNSQCTLSGAGSSVSGSVNNLTVNVALTFKAAFAGAKNVYLNAQNSGGMWSNWQQLGAWTVPAGGNLPPSNISVTPSSGNGSSQTFSFVFSDPNGYTDLSTTYMLINSVLDWPGSCYTFYDRNSNVLWLLNDAGNFLLGPVTPGSATTVQNSQCVLNGAGSTVSGFGDNLTVNIALTFKAAFGGAKNLYLNAQDSAGLWSNWQALGSWTVPVAGNQPPTNISVTPSSGSGSSQTFSFVFSDPDGFADLSTTYMLINSVLNWPNACYTFYDRNANQLSLLSDSGTYLVGSVTPGQSATLQNSQCTLSGAGSSVSPAGNNLTINVALTFKAAFGGAKNVYLNAQDSAGLWSNWQALGTWTAQ